MDWRLSRPARLDRREARATLPPSRQRPGGVALLRPRSERGTVRAARDRRRERHPRAETAGARYRVERAPDQPAAMSEPIPPPNQQVVPRPVRPLDERAFDSLAEQAGPTR